jgi:hypothetical protein
VIRCVLGIVILAIVFSLGVKLGEFKGALESGYGYRMMRAPYYGGGYDGGYGGGYPTIQNGQGGGAVIPPQAAPATPAK